MKRKDYERPTMRVVQLKHRTQILTISNYETTGSGRTSLTKMENDTDL